MGGQPIDLSEFGAKPISAPSSSAHAPMDLSEFGAKPISPSTGKTPPSPGWFDRADSAITSFLAPNPANLQQPHPLGQIVSQGLADPEAAKTLGREVYSGVKTVAGMPAGIYHAFTDNPTPEETKDYGTPQSPDVIDRIGLGVGRIGVIPVKRAIQDYSAGKVTPDAALENAPEAIGSAAGNVVGGKLIESAMPKVAAAGNAALEKTGGAIQKVGQTAADATRAAYGIANPESLDAVQSATKALKPRNSKVNWQQDVQSALPDVRRAIDNAGVDVKSASLDDVERATLQAKKDVWAEYDQNFSDPNKGAAVDTSPVAKTIRGTVSQRTLEQNPTLADRVEAIARTYDGRQLSVSDLEDRIGELNNETRGIEARYPADKAAAQVMPENAPTFAERNALRNLLTSKLDELSGPGAQALRDRYGALKSFQDVLQRRKQVYERAAPESLGEAVGRFTGVGQMVKGTAKVLTGQPSGLADIAGGAVTRAAAKAGRQMNDSQFLIRQALQKTVPRGPVVPRMQGEYIAPPALRMLRGTQGTLPAGQYEAPASPLPPQGQLPAPVVEGEYVQEGAPRPRVAGFLPRGVYHNPSGVEAPLAPQLPPYRGIPLPAKGPKPSVSRYTRTQGEMR
jgi:hypothetical protein